MISLLGSAGCATTLPPPAESAADNGVLFLTQALEAKPERREMLWRTYGDSDGSELSELHVALLQSLPDHSGFDPGAARRRLAVLLARKPRSDIAAVAQLRLDELKIDQDCRSDVAALRERLARMIEIEDTIQRKDP